MSLMESLLVFLAIISSYIILVFILKKKGILEKYNISLWGPALMWRTKKGRNFLKKIAKKKKFWKAFGSSGIVLCFVIMIFMTILVIWQAWFVFGLTPEQREELPLTPEFILAIPGINPLLPLDYVGYILVTFIIAIIVHEFSHGILAYASKIKVKSLGILYLIVPIGAFVEPDEKELKKAKTKPRMRIFAAGPTANFIVVIITIFLFSFVFMSSVQPASDGIGIFSVDKDSPADGIGISAGMMITSINDSRVTNNSGYFHEISKTRANQTVNISYVYKELSYNKTVILSDMYEEYSERNYPINESYKGIGYVGINLNPYIDFLPIMQNPFKNFPQYFAFFWAIPFLGFSLGFNPLVAPFTEYYVIAGPMGFIPDTLFWIIINALYWIFWLNFAVAIFNVLPIIPLDGGFLINDAINSFVKRIKRGITDEQREKLVKNVTILISLIVLFLVFSPFLLRLFESLLY